MQGCPYMPLHGLTECRWPYEFVGNKRKQMPFKITIVFSQDGAGQRRHAKLSVRCSGEDGSVTPLDTLSGSECSKMGLERTKLPRAI